MRDSVSKLAFEDVRDDIINKSLVAGSIIGLIAYVLSLTAVVKFGFELSHLTDLLILGVIFLITVFRRKLPILIKSYVILLGILVVVLVDIYELGVFSANKVLLILIPFFAIISIGLRQTMILIALILMLIAVLGFLHMNGYFPHFDEIEVIANVGLTSWLINFIMVGIVTFVVVLIIQKFSESYEDSIQELKSRNVQILEREVQLEEYKNELEAKVDSRTKELKSANDLLITQAEELKETLNELHNTQAKLIHSEKMSSLGVLASGVAHEINNPLNFIQGGITGLEDFLKSNKLDEENDEIRKLVLAVKIGIKRTSDILKSLNQYSKFDSGEFESCDLKDIVDNCLTMIQGQMDSSVTIVKEFQDDLPLIEGNSSKLYQVVINLLTNAQDAVENNGEIVVVLIQSGNEILLKVKDDGIGIEEENISKITDPFYSTKDPGKEPALGCTLYLT